MLKNKKNRRSTDGAVGIARRILSSKYNALVSRSTLNKRANLSNRSNRKEFSGEKSSAKKDHGIVERKSIGNQIDFAYPKDVSLGLSNIRLLTFLLGSEPI